MLASCFALQLVLGPWAGLLSPTLQALVAEGGLARGLVAQGQWYRLVSAAFLHGDLLHLLFNGLALALGGAILEQLVGRWWFLVVYGLSLLGGSLASLAFNAPEVISVGASGAIMGVLAAAFVATARLPFGRVRTSAQLHLVYWLVPALLPLTLHRDGSRIDFGAHAGGAVTGGLLGALLLVNAWRSGEPRPGAKGLARALAVLVLGLLAAGLGQAALQGPALWRALEARALVAPDERYEGVGRWSQAQTVAEVARLRLEFPHDPRAIYLAAVLEDQLGDQEKVVPLLRQALAEREVLELGFSGFEDRLRTRLAMELLQRGAEAEAREAFRPVCPRVVDGQAKVALPDAFVQEACAP
ncbi:MAG: rhomboid family intramembrane serine protease [Anaeromyxobacter sp.]